jgi:predicted transposase YdaD
MDVQKDLLAQVSDPKLQADLMATAIVVDIRSFGTQIVLAKFAKEVNMLKDTSIVQGWISEGRQEGQQIGQREGKLAVIQSLLVKKFGPLSPTVLLQLQRLSNERVDRLTLAFLDINCQEELQAWLRNGASDSSIN